MEAYLNKNIPDNELEKIVISNNKISSSFDFKYTEENEFVYNGNFYNIVHKQNDGYNTTFYCISDTNEDKLFEGLNEHIKQNNDPNLPVRNKSIQIIKNIIKEALPDNSVAINDNQKKFNTHFSYKYFQKEPFINIHSPPPKT